MKYREIDRLKLPSCKNEAIGERYYCCICGGKKEDRDLSILPHSACCLDKFFQSAEENDL